ncbi:hypothetical protein CCE01nite_12940 [Cellulomonas cellasea]|uniref:Uncharacterized protein n=1 Tax=Cellulomonas cellasea TaxID=43670 RepID=A0A4Y3KVS0_9CELL|nr:hypothetical protein CCE01nite_12940 [Cellulomonas cellasea]
MGARGLLALQRRAGNAAVSALVRGTGSGDGTGTRFDAALTQPRTAEPHDSRRAPPPVQRQEPGAATEESPTGVADQPGVPEGWMVLPFPMATWHEISRGTQLSREETERRRRLLEQSAIKVAPSYPWAAAMLLRWLAGTAKEQLLNLTPEQLLRDDSGFPAAVRTSIRDVLRKGVAARLDESHPEHVAPDQRELHLRGTGSFDFIGPGQSPSSLSMFQKDLSIALGGVSYTIDAHVALRWTNGTLTSAHVTAAQISIVDHYDFNLDDLAMVPLPPGTSMPADLAVAPLPPGLSLQDLPLPEEVVQTTISFQGQEWIVVKDAWLSDIAVSGGAVNYPVRIEAFAIPPGLFDPFVVSGAAVE